MEMNAQAQPYTGAPTQPKSIWSIMVGVFTSPAEAFQAYKQKPTIIIPIILVAILLAITGAATAKYGAILQYDMLKTSEMLPPAALEQMRQGIENPNYISAAIMGPIFLIIMGLIEALIAMFLGNVVFAGQSKFKPIWGVAILTALITAVGGLIRIPLVYAKGTMLVSIGFAALMPGKDFTSMLYAFLYFADVFAIWGVIVAGIAYSTIFGISRGKGMAISIIGFLILTIIGIGLQAMGLSLAGVEVGLL
jgi:hypothetical protein